MWRGEEDWPCYTGNIKLEVIFYIMRLLSGLVCIYDILV